MEDTNAGSSKTELFIIHDHTQIIGELSQRSVRLAADNLLRDIKKCCIPTEKSPSYIELRSGKQNKECFYIYVTGHCLIVEASDPLGFIYGIYEISRRILGIQPFWFWNEQKIKKQESYCITADYKVKSQPYRIRYRGWFLNDEVLLHTWSVDGRKEIPWEMAFEALLRCGGNMVIPGTDQNAAKYRGLASDMGLAITHHHAEPLGAAMFARKYPDLTPSYIKYPQLFQKLWQDAVAAQKNHTIIWNLGFRGQGDRPFWEDDPQSQTPEARGQLISSLIRMQYEMVKQEVPDASCCTYLYGEVMELYQQGVLSLPEDVIKVWADNGYGKMVTRRQGNHNPRVPALPEIQHDSQHPQRNGIYYHVSFYDLQAGNHITMLPNSPTFVIGELKNVIQHGGTAYWIINSSNIKPHVYMLDLISEIWRTGDVDIEEQLSRYVTDYYGIPHLYEISNCFRDYYKYAVSYGDHEDEHAGEQFVNHIPRMFISQYMIDRTRPQELLSWATNANRLEDQIQWFHQITKKAVAGYQNYLDECNQVAKLMESQEKGKAQQTVGSQETDESQQADKSLKSDAKELFCDSVLLQAQIYAHCFLGADKVCQSLIAAGDGDYMQSFYLAGQAKEEYLLANQAMRDREHDKWKGFYENECLTDVKQTAWVLDGFMSYLRNAGDGPHFYRWQRNLLYSEEDRRVMLILNMENHLDDQSLYTLMKDKWNESARR